MMMIGYAGNIDPDAPGIGVLRVTLRIAPEKGDLTGSLFASFNQRNAPLLLLLPPAFTAGFFI